MGTSWQFGLLRTWAASYSLACLGHRWSKSAAGPLCCSQVAVQIAEHGLEYCIFFPTIAWAMVSTLCSRRQYIGAYVADGVPMSLMHSLSMWSGCCGARHFCTGALCPCADDSTTYVGVGGCWFDMASS